MAEEGITGKMPSNLSLSTRSSREKEAGARPVKTSTVPIRAPAAAQDDGTSGFDIDDYFTGPRDPSRHSKWPLFMQMHGSILPKMVIPLLFVAGWSSAVTVVSKLVQDLGVSSVLMTITGFVVGLGLSFRSSTAYERYSDGRKAWTQIVQASQCLGRVFWIHAQDVPGRDPRETILKRVSCMNMVMAFAVALKHRLRFEPYTAYEDLEHLVGYLPTFAREATGGEPDKAAQRKQKSLVKETGEYLGVSFAQSNPRKVMKQTGYPLGNLPLEILNHLAITIDKMIRDGQFPVPMTQTLAYNNLALLNDAMAGTERVLNTPLPIAYQIAISQITWVYVCLLPFQLYPVLGWITIPATVAASYIILGILMIGREIENPFGRDVNDLRLETYCEQIALELDVIASHDNSISDCFIESPSNHPLYPVNMASYEEWMESSEEKLREAIRTKPATTFAALASVKRCSKATPAGEEQV